MKPGALLLLFLATSCASIVGDDFFIEREHDPPPEAPYIPADCIFLQCPCGADVGEGFYCPSEDPVGCDVLPVDACPGGPPQATIYWCCEYAG